MSLNFKQARSVMVEQQIRPWEVLDPRVLAVLTSVPREDFVPPEHRQLAYTDLALPLAHGETMMKPLIEGRMLQALSIAPGHEVLEVGTGSAYVTACLARLAREVLSIDIHDDFVTEARGKLKSQGIENVRVECADVFSFQPERRFDAIAVTAAVTKLPKSFTDWLKPGGRLFIICGLSPAQSALRLTRRESGIHEERLFETDVPYLHGAEPAPNFVL